MLLGFFGVPPYCRSSVPSLFLVLFPGPELVTRIFEFVSFRHAAILTCLPFHHLAKRLGCGVSYEIITGPDSRSGSIAMEMTLADCRVKITVDVIRGKWKAIIIKALKDRSLGYAELRRIVPEPTKKVLTDHLRELEQDRIISRTRSTGLVRTEYSLTEYGRTLIPVLAVMRAWGQTHRELVLGHPRDAEDGTDACAVPPSSNSKPLRG